MNSALHVSFEHIRMLVCNHMLLVLSHSVQTSLAVALKDPVASIHPRPTESVAEIALTVHHSFMSIFYDPNYMLAP